MRILEAISRAADSLRGRGAQAGDIWNWVATLQLGVT